MLAAELLATITLEDATTVEKWHPVPFPVKCHPVAPIS